MLGVRRAGDIMRAEFARAGIQISSCRIISLWKHGKNKECPIDSHLDAVVKELTGHEWVILTGSEISKILVDHSIMEITGLSVKSKTFPKIKFFGIPNAGNLMRGDVGEMRLALEKFMNLRSKKK
jgi:hypothetical protein